jgi:1-acyl-sn-glycerol-3-phosphate acyltransferase
VINQVNESDTATGSQNHWTQSSSLAALITMVDYVAYGLFWGINRYYRQTAPRIDIQASDLRAGTSYVLAANHQRGGDPFIITTSLPFGIWRKLTPYRYFAHNGLFTSSVRRAGLLAMGAFPTHANGRYPHGLKLASALLKANHTVFIFPEGRRVTTEPVPAKLGVGVLAQLPNVAIIPAYIEWSGHPKRYRLIIGKPLMAHGLSADQILAKIYELGLHRPTTQGTI